MINMNKKDYKDLAENLLDFLLNNFDAIEIVERLIYYGFNKNHIKALGFTIDDIEKAQDSIEKLLSDNE